MVGQYQCGHGFYYRHSTWHYTRVMTALARYFRNITIRINRLLVMHNGGHGLKGYPELNRHPIADAALDTAREIGKRNNFSGPLSLGEGWGEVKNVVMFRTQHLAAAETRTEFKAVHGIDT